MCLSVLPADMCAPYKCLAPVEVRGGSWIHWHWSYRWCVTGTCGNKDSEWWVVKWEDPGWGPKKIPLRHRLYPPHKSALGQEHRANIPFVGSSGFLRKPWINVALNSCECHVGARNLTLVLYKSSMHSYPLSHLFCTPDRNFWYC